MLGLKTAVKNFLLGIYYKDYYKKLEDLLYIYKANNFKLVRVGAANDGGYIMLDDFVTGGGASYSFGIGSEISWDADMAKRGYDVFMYDHTIDNLPYLDPKFHFFKEGIADSENPADNRLHSLEYYLNKNNHENNNNMILKMDVEGAEWGFLSLVSSDTLKKFGQMVFEFHNINSLLKDKPENILAIFEKINKTHKLVHLHVNNCCGGISFNGKIFGNVIEATYVNIEKYNFSVNDDINLPLDIDSPNVLNNDEIYLGHWNKKFDMEHRVKVKNI